MKVSQTFPSRYFKGQDMAGQELVLTIADVRMEVMEMSNEEKAVVHFEEHNSALILNKSNARALAEELGDDTDEWYGHRIVLGTADTTYNGRTMPGLRVRAAGPNDAAPVAARPPARSVDAANDELNAVADAAQEDEAPF